jgi:hypothetical protein
MPYPTTSKKLSQPIVGGISLTMFDLAQTQTQEKAHSLGRRLPHAKRALYSGINPAEGRVSHF